MGLGPGEAEELWDCSVFPVLPGLLFWCVRCFVFFFCFFPFFFFFFFLFFFGGGGGSLKVLEYIAIKIITEGAERNHH